MNDFLRNLRSSHKKENPSPQKNVDSRFYQSDRRVLRDRRGSALPQDPMLRELSDILPQFLDTIAVMTEQVERLATIAEMEAESKIRHHNAAADFYDNLKTFIREAPAAAYSGMDRPRATASYASGTHYTKDDILSIINGMRDQGATYAIIADYLKEKGIPTFSGRGDWHAQTIHRLCK